MYSDDFRQQLLENQRPTREMIITSGDPGCEPITKISGVPWWPTGLSRPTCGNGHPMSFMAQFRLSDIPLFESQRDSLVSFHYCEQCSYEGNMSFGWNADYGNITGYDVSVLTDISDKVEIKVQRNVCPTLISRRRVVAVCSRSFGN